MHTIVHKPESVTDCIGPAYNEPEGLSGPHCGKNLGRRSLGPAASQLVEGGCDYDFSSEAAM
jgi:hypothetical protein